MRRTSIREIGPHPSWMRHPKRYAMTHCSHQVDLAAACSSCRTRGLAPTRCERIMDWLIRRFG